jgi:hypothetical protein
MKTWSAMYLVIWVAFFQILVILMGEPLLGANITNALHDVIGVAVIALTWYSYSLVRKTACPDRIKRIQKTTRSMAIAGGVLGLILYAGMVFNLGSIFYGVFLFLHISIAIAIITQASSSATAYDMWEEKEYVTQPPVTP